MPGSKPFQVTTLEISGVVLMKKDEVPANDGKKEVQPGFCVGSRVNTVDAANKKEANGIHGGEVLVLNV